MKLSNEPPRIQNCHKQFSTITHNVNYPILITFLHLSEQEVFRICIDECL